MDNCRLNWFMGSDDFQEHVPNTDSKKEYYAYVNALLRNLTNFSLYLKTKAKDQRKRMLKILLKKINNELKTRRQSHKSVFSQGVYMPFSSNNKNSPSNLVN